MSPSLRGRLTAVVACTLLLAGGFTWRAVEHLADNRKPLITLRLLGEPGRRVTATIRLMRDWDGTNESWLEEMTVPWTASYRAAGVDVRWVSFGPARLGDVRAEVESTRDDFDQDQLATFIDASRTGSWDVLLES
ncbi:MAG: hypothetical protein ACYTGX_03130, partial [Planctomycetota bacterium]